MSRSALLNIMVNTALKAGRGLIRDFGEVENLQVSRKGPAEFVSISGQRAEKIIREELLKARPTYSMLVQNGEDIKGMDGQHRWIIDPLDGTTNFIHAIPLFCVSIALERNGEVVASVIYNPIMDELYTAEKGNGAWQNNRRLRIASRRHMADAMVSNGIKFTGKESDLVSLRQLAHISPQVAGVRRLGSTALELAWVAAGRLDGVWEDRLNPWEVAAGAFIVKESGGFVTDFKGGQNFVTRGEIVAGNEYLQPALLKTIQSVE